MASLVKPLLICTKTSIPCEQMLLSAITVISWSLPICHLRRSDQASQPLGETELHAHCLWDLPKQSYLKNICRNFMSSFAVGMGSTPDFMDHGGRSFQSLSSAQYTNPFLKFTSSARKFRVEIILSPVKLISNFFHPCIPDQRFTESLNSLG